MKNNIILVPYDFTSISQVAVRHACVVAQKADAKVQLLHVVDEQNEVEKARKKLAEDLLKFSSCGAEFETYVRVGSIYDEIGDHATEIGAKYICMGTHGMHGMQFITGSRALKVITSSDVPFIVVQEREPRNSGFKKIVVPIDLSKESKQKLKYVVQMSKVFGSKAYVIVPDEDDEDAKRDIKLNVKFAKNYLLEHKVEHEVAVAGDDDFDKEVIKFAAKIDADLILIMNLQGSSLLSFLGNNYVQSIITNASQVPVMCVNPKELSSQSGMGLY